MTRLLITTIRRNTPPTVPSGKIYLVDAEKQQVLQQSEMIEPAFREVDTNPRGGMRGGRGIAVGNGEIAIANASVIFRYDTHWNLRGIISNPSMAAIHDVMYDDESIWATSARNDLVFQYNLDGTLLRHFYLRDSSPATRALKWEPTPLLQPEGVREGAIEFRDPRTHSEETYDHAHVNSICRLEDGRLLVSMGLVLNSGFSTLLRIKSGLVKAGWWPSLLSVNRAIRSALRMKKNPHSDLVVQPARARSAIIELCPDGSHNLTLRLEGVTVPSHSLLALPDGSAAYLQTTSGEVVHFDPQTGRILSATPITDGFLRGATRLPSDLLALGSKRELLTFDLKKRRLAERLDISQDANESIYDIKILPEDFDNPPKAFEERFQQAAGFPSSELHTHQYVIPTAEIGQA